MYSYDCNKDNYYPFCKVHSCLISIKYNQGYIVCIRVMSLPKYSLLHRDSNYLDRINMYNHLLMVRSLDNNLPHKLYTKLLKYMPNNSQCYKSNIDLLVEYLSKYSSHRTPSHIIHKRLNHWCKKDMDKGIGYM